MVTGEIEYKITKVLYSIYLLIRKREYSLGIIWFVNSIVKSLTKMEECLWVPLQS